MCAPGALSNQCRLHKTKKHTVPCRGFKLYFKLPGPSQYVILHYRYFPCKKDTKKGELLRDVFFLEICYEVFAKQKNHGRAGLYSAGEKVGRAERQKSYGSRGAIW